MQIGNRQKKGETKKNKKRTKRRKKNKKGETKKGKPSFASKPLTYFAVNLLGRVHASHGQGISRRAFLLLGLRQIADGPSLHLEGGTPLLHRLLRKALLKHLRKMRQNHRNRLQGSLLQREALARVVLRVLHLQQ